MYFQEGDIVEWGGVRGVITQICVESDPDYPIFVKYLNAEFDRFTIDGKVFRSFGHHEDGVLKLIERPKLKKLVPHWRAIYTDGICIYCSDVLFRTDNQALAYYAFSSPKSSMPNGKLIRLATEYPPIMLEVEDV